MCMQSCAYMSSGVADMGYHISACVMQAWPLSHAQENSGCLLTCDGNVQKFWQNACLCTYTSNTGCELKGQKCIKQDFLKNFSLWIFYTSPSSVMSVKQTTYKINIKLMVILITAYFTADHLLLTFFKHTRSYFWFNLDSKTLFYKDCSLVCKQPVINNYWWIIIKNKNVQGIIYIHKCSMNEWVKMYAWIIKRPKQTHCVHSTRCTHHTVHTPLNYTCIFKHTTSR